MTRRTYYSPQGAGPYRNQPEEEPEQDQAPPAPPPPSGGSWLKTGLTIALSAVVGAVAVDIYRRYFSKSRNPEEGDDAAAGGFSAMGAMPGAPSIMPMPLPLPFPMPMPMPNYGFGPPQGYRDERPLTDNDRLELARLEAETAKAKADQARWEAWESGEID